MVSIDLDFTLLVQAVNFFLILLALNYFLYRPIRKVLADRQDLMDSLTQRANAARATLESGEERQAAIEAESVKLALETKSGVKNEGIEEEKNILSQAQAKAAGELDSARKTMQAEIAAARSILAEDARGLAQEMAGRILGRSL